MTPPSVTITRVGILKLMAGLVSSSDIPASLHPSSLPAPWSCVPSGASEGCLVSQCWSSDGGRASSLVGWNYLSAVAL